MYIFQPQLESAILDVKKKFGELHEKWQFN